MLSNSFTCLIVPCLFIWFPGVVGQCEGNKVKMLTADTVQRTFDSPNYPGKYPSNAKCQWLLVAPSEEHIIKVETLAMNMEVTEGCQYDSVTLLNGDSQESELLSRYCVGYFSQYSTGQYMLVVFTSDATYELTGFRLRYVAQLKNPPTGHTTAATTTTEKSEKKDEQNWINTGALIGGVVGGGCFVVILGIVFSRCKSRGRQLRQPPAYRAAAFYNSHAPPSSSPLHEELEGNTAMSTAVHLMQSNNTVFMVSQALGSGAGRNLSPARFMAGVTNMGFEGGGEADLDGYRSGGLLPPPPSYNESMLVTHPPALPPTPRRHGLASFANGLGPPPLHAAGYHWASASGEDQPSPVSPVRIEISSPDESEAPHGSENHQQSEYSVPSSPQAENVQQSDVSPVDTDSSQPSDICPVPSQPDCPEASPETLHSSSLGTSASIPMNPDPFCNSADQPLGTAEEQTELDSGEVTQSPEICQEETSTLAPDPGDQEDNEVAIPPVKESECLGESQQISDPQIPVKTDDINSDVQEELASAVEEADLETTAPSTE